MAEQTAITWTDSTFNPWIGCQHVAPGCKNCYAEGYAKRYGKAKWGPQGTRRKTSDAYWRKPLTWNRDAAAGPAVCDQCGEIVVQEPHLQTNGITARECFGTAKPKRPRVFCASLADVFEDWDGPIHGNNGCPVLVCPCGNMVSSILRGGVPYSAECSACDNAHPGPMRPLTMEDLRRDLGALWDATPYVDWLVLTKRIENARRMWPVHAQWFGSKYPEGDDRLNYRPNFWLGTSVSDQATADQNVPELLGCRDLCPVLFLSVEPLLGPVDLSKWLPELDWIIVGGESGPKHRPMDLGWAESLREQCRAAGVPFFFKQIAANKPGQGAAALGTLIQEFPSRTSIPSMSSISEASP